MMPIIFRHILKKRIGCLIVSTSAALMLSVLMLSALHRQSASAETAHAIHDTPTTLRSSGTFTWPTWARAARIAGSFFYTSDTTASIDAQLDALAAQSVSVVLADSPWGWSYSAWVDDAEFDAVRALVLTMTQHAHARGLKVVMYLTGLELTAEPQRNPYLEHPEWAQLSITGTPIVFTDVTNQQEHWLESGVYDYWLSPCSSFRAFSAARLPAVVGTGVDGLWVDTTYLEHSIGNHQDLWPSSDPCSVYGFTSTTGLSMPLVENFNDPSWRRWIEYRKTQTVDFLLALKAAARAVNPDIVFLEENWNADTAGAMFYANDPADYLAYPDLSTGHEVSSIADRVDLGQTGMLSATLDQWLSFRSMMAFTRAADRSKPSWILTYGYQPRDSAQLAGMVLAEGANFYETQGPGMAGTVSESYRTQLFRWISAHESTLYAGDSSAQIGLLFSPRNRDLLDQGAGTYYTPTGATHFTAYRAVANLLYRAHVPFNVVLDTDTSVFNRYASLIVPEVQAMSDASAAALRAYTGTLITIGDNTGAYDEWLASRTTNALAGVTQTHFATVSPAVVTAANTNQLSTGAPAEIQIGSWRAPEGYALMFVNTALTAAGAFTLDVRLSNGTTIRAAHLSAPDGMERDLTGSTLGNNTFRLNVPTGIDSLALLTLSTRGQQVYLPLTIR